MAKDSYWFKHDSTAGRGFRMLKMKHIYGFWGVGIYWCVIEVLREQDGYVFPSDESSLQMLSEIINCKDESKFISWVNDCIEIGLFQRENGHFYSEILIENMKVWEAKKANGSKGGRPQEKPKPKPKRKLNHNLTNNLNETESKANQNHKIIEDNIRYIYIKKEKIIDLYEYLKDGHSIFLEQFSISGKLDPVEFLDAFIEENNTFEFKDDNQLKNYLKGYRTIFLKQKEKKEKEESSAKEEKEKIRKRPEL